MKRFSMVLLCVIAAMGQDPRKTYGYIEAPIWDNLPLDMDKFLNLLPASPWFRVNVELNPFYLRGDFDGDGQMDYAFSIHSGDYYGILYLFHAKGNSSIFICGAETKVAGKGQAPAEGIGRANYWKVLDPAKGSKRERIETGLAETDLVERVTFTGKGCLVE